MLFNKARKIINNIFCYLLAPIKNYTLLSEDLRQTTMTKERKYPAGTTKEQWDNYEIRKAEHDAYCERTMPLASQFGYEPNGIESQGGWTIEGGEEAYHNAVSQWKMMRSMDAPNEPGYYRANND